jgi:rhodanese-related sulfurtransferase
VSRAIAPRHRVTGAATAVHRLLPAALAIVLLLAIAACQSVPRAAATVSADYARYADPANLQQLISKKTEPYILVDVRTLDEYTSGHIPTAINIPYDKIGENPPTSDLNALIIVYCKSGGRSRSAAQTLEGRGYLHIVDFGTIGRWTGALNTTTQPGECPCGIN